MQYAKFRNLLAAGETDHTDFKIRCDAFADSTDSSRGELAKDICAMANNGNRASYIVVGVSNDRKAFRSVDNEKLTDDHLQDFVKRAIYPPPKTIVHRVTWKRALPKHAGKMFVIIQVGPNRRQAFRLAQDFIDYKERVSYRRNEVWIRRNATSDLATPEEIARLVSGKSPHVDPNDLQRQADRGCFSRLSQHEQKASMRSATKETLIELGFVELSKKDWLGSRTYEGGGGLRHPSFWRRSGRTVVMVCLFLCSVSLTRGDLERLTYLSEGFSEEFVKWDSLPKDITHLTRRRVWAVRRIWLAAILGSVPQSRIASVFQDSRRLGSHLHFYRPQFREPRHSQLERKPVTSSSELLILEKIRSLPDYKKALERALVDTENATEALIKP